MKNCTREVFGVLVLGFWLGVCVASAADQIQVTSAVPNNAAQGTVNLDVVVKGNGFQKGAVVQWFVSGTTNPGGVTVNSTAFNSANQVTANITVAADGVIGGFDIVVKNSNGRTGKGTELFAVNSSSSKSSCVAPLAINPLVNACSSSTPQTACLDSNFGADGFVLNNLDVATVIRQQSDGKLVAIGYSNNAVTAARYGADGALDTSFGNGGVMQYGFPGAPTTSVYDAIFDANDNLLVTGFESYNEYVLRFTSTGALDTSFGSGGAYIRAGNSKTAYVGEGLALEPDGKIIVAGAGQGTRNWEGLVTRLSANGTVDTSFGTGGTASVTNSGTSSNSFYAPAIQTVGSVNYVLAGGALGPNNSVAIARFTMSGVLDPTFGINGQTAISFCGNAGRVGSLAFDPSGNILAAGSTSFGGPNFMVLARFSPSGALDTSFGDPATSGSGKTGSTLTNVFGGNTIGFRTTMTPVTDSLGNTRILFAGTGGTTGYFVLARYNSDGALDNTFGGTGVVAANGGISNIGYGVTVQSNGEIVEAGTTKLSSGSYSGYNFALVRFWP
jgi:uncharacterized delta-60 repeat protein